MFARERLTPGVFFPIEALKGDTPTSLAAWPFSNNWSNWND
jgi:hypothetical protein